MTDDINLPDDGDDDDDSPLLSRQAQLARQFQQDFQKQFDAADAVEEGGNGTYMFSIQKVQFDEWCVKNNLLSTIPGTVDDPELRAGLMMKRNEIRLSINNAARFGRHKCWPPYDIGNDKEEKYLVRLIQPFFEAAHGELTKRIETYYVGKTKFLKALGRKYLNDERLPPHLQEAWKKNEMAADIMKQYIEFSLKSCLEHFAKTRHYTEEFYKNHGGNGKKGNEHRRITRPKPTPRSDPQPPAPGDDD